MLAKVASCSSWVGCNENEVADQLRVCAPGFSHVQSDEAFFFMAWLNFEDDAVFDTHAFNRGNVCLNLYPSLKEFWRVIGVI